MKKITLAVLGICCLTAAFTQINAHQWLVGGKGKLSFTSQDYLNDKIKESTFRLSPNIGYFPKDKWAIGINLDFESSTYEFPGNNKEKYNEIGAGIFSRYYFLDKIRKTNIFVDGGYNIGGYKYDTDDERTNYNKFMLGLAAAFFINQHVAFELGIDYSSRKWEDENERINRFGLCGGFQIHLDPCVKVVRPKEASVQTY